MAFVTASVAGVGLSTDGVLDGRLRFGATRGEFANEVLGRVVDKIAPSRDQISGECIASIRLTGVQLRGYRPSFVGFAMRDIRGPVERLCSTENADEMPG